MRKKDVSSVRKEFKMDNPKLKLGDVVSIYVKGDIKEIIGTEKEYFGRMDTGKQELYLKNFKKLLTGPLDSKVFELEFSDNKLGQNPSQRDLIQTLQAGDFMDRAEVIAHKIIRHCDYQSDFMISFLRGEVYIPTKKEEREAEESGLDDEVFSFQFFMGCVNPVTIPKTALKFDFEVKTFKADIPLDVVINLTAPLEGFMFPSWQDNSADVNSVVYYANKANTPNLEFLDKVLACDLHSTAQAEKTQFLEILQEVAGKEIEPEKIANIYENVNYLLTRNEEETSDIPCVGLKDMAKILQASGVENTQGLETAFQKVTGTDKYEFKAANIVPNFTGKSIKIENNTVSLSVSPQDLKYIKQVKKDGRRYLLIEIDETVNLEGFELSTETF